MATIKSEFDYIQEARSKLATALINKFGVRELDIMNADGTVKSPGLWKMKSDGNGGYEKDYLKRLYDWSVLVSGTNVHTDGSISFKNTSNVTKSFNGSTDLDLTGGIYYAKYSDLAELAKLLALATSTSTVDTAKGTWTPVANKEYVFRQKWTNSAAGNDTADLCIYLDGNLTANMCLDGYYYSLAGFKKSGSSDSYVLLGGGGHKALSDFSMSHTHPYVKLAGDTMTGNLILKGSTSNVMTYAGNVHPRIRFANSDASQNVDIIFTDYDSYRASAGIKIIGNQTGEWFEVAGNIFSTGYHHLTHDNNDSILLAGGSYKALSDFSFTLGATKVNIGDTVTTIAGPFAVNTSATSSKAFSILRDGTEEGVKHWVDDSAYHIDYTNDEAASSIIFRLINTDTERADNKGAAATDKSITFSHTGYITSSGFIKSGSSSAYLLTGDGGHIAITKTVNNVSTDSQIPTALSVYSAINAGFAANDAMLYKGTYTGTTSASTVDINKFSTKPGKTSLGWTWKVSTAGYFGNQPIEVGDMIIASVEEPGNVITNYNIILYNIDMNSEVLRRYAWWQSSATHDANTLRGGTTFAYSTHNGVSSNAATTGTIVAFDCSTNTNYTLQLQGLYNGENLYFRNRNGDNENWNAWRTIIHSGNYKSYMDDLYWANVSILQSSSTTTTPLFGLIGVGGAVINGYVANLAGNTITNGTSRFNNSSTWYSNNSSTYYTNTSGGTSTAYYTLSVANDLTITTKGGGNSTTASSDKTWIFNRSNGYTCCPSYINTNIGAENSTKPTHVYFTYNSDNWIRKMAWTSFTDYIRKDYYWANLGVQNTINYTTIPTFGKVIINKPSDYNKDSTYTVGTYVYKDGLVYKCTTAITAAQEWTASNWTLDTRTLFNNGNLYNASEIYTGTINTGHTYVREGSSIGFRDGNSGYYTQLRYDTAGNEALILGMKNAATSFIVKSGDSGTTSTTTTGFTASEFVPSILVKGQALYVNKLIANGVSPEYNFCDNGTSLFTDTMHITAGTGNYCEGIRIERADSTWATIILGATGTSGTNENAWSIHRTNGNNFSISRNSSDGANGMFLGKNGRVGFGTSSPETKLHIEGGNVRISSSNAGSGGDVYTELWRGTNASWRLLNSGGNFYIQSNYTTKTTSYFNCLQLDYNTGDAHFKRYVYGNYFNTNISNESFTPTHVYCSNDTWIRRMAFSTFSNKVLENQMPTITITKSFTANSISSTWTDTGIADSDLATGSYILEITITNSEGTSTSVNNTWYFRASGVMSWYLGDTNDTEYDEIILHRAGHAYHNVLYLRTLLTSTGNGGMKLLICSNNTLATAMYVTFKFKKIF